jgi:hypothetical protein
VVRTARCAAPAPQGASLPLTSQDLLGRAISTRFVALERMPKKTAAVREKHAIFFALMAILKKNAFSRRVPDLVTEELVAVLSRRSSFEFKQLFDIVHENLRARNAASGGEEMLRLRAYEKLQNLVARGAVKKNGKKYKGLPSALANAIAQQNGHLVGVR